MFLRKVFVSHYCNIPFHMLDETASRALDKNGVYPVTLTEELYAASFHLVRNFELAPFTQNSDLEDRISDLVENDKI